MQLTLLAPWRSVACTAAKPPMASIRMCDEQEPIAELPRRLRRLANALRAVDSRERLVRLMRLGDGLPMAPMCARGGRTPPSLLDSPLLPHTLTPVVFALSRISQY